MPSADQVPVKTTHSTMLWPKSVVLIAGSTGSALRAVRPFQPSHHAGCPTRFLSRRECDGFPIALTPGHHRPYHPGNLVGERALAVIRYAKTHGTKHRPWLTALLARRPTKVAAIAGRKQAAQIAIALFAD